MQTAVVGGILPVLVASTLAREYYKAQGKSPDTPAKVGQARGLDSVGINRREVVNESVMQERSSDHPDP